MLEWVATPYGEAVPKFNGTLLISKVDPFKEARTWLSHHVPQIESTDKHVVLGIGSGHHIVEMAVRFHEKEFICIEYLESLSFSAQYNQLRTMPNVELIVGTDEKKIFKNERIQKTLRNVFTILKHPRAIKISEPFYDRVEDILTGHTWKTFNQVLKFRPSEDLFLNEMNFSSKSNNEISAKEIIEFVTGKNGEHSDNEMIWMALGELLK